MVWTSNNQLTAGPQLHVDGFQHGLHRVEAVQERAVRQVEQRHSGVGMRTHRQRVAVSTDAHALTPARDLSGVRAGRSEFKQRCSRGEVKHVNHAHLCTRPAVARVQTSYHHTGVAANSPGVLHRERSQLTAFQGDLSHAVIAVVCNHQVVLVGEAQPARRVQRSLPRCSVQLTDDAVQIALGELVDQQTVALVVPLAVRDNGHVSASCVDSHAVLFHSGHNVAAHKLARWQERIELRWSCGVNRKGLASDGTVTRYVHGQLC